MSSKRDWVIGLVANMLNSNPTNAMQEAEMIVDRLMEEGVLHLGYGNADVDAIVNSFTDSFGTTKVSRGDRFAAHRLAGKYGSQSVVGIITLLAENSQNKYAPVVGSVTQLEDKWVSVLNFLRKTKDSEEIIDV